MLNSTLIYFSEYDLSGQSAMMSVHERVHAYDYDYDHGYGYGYGLRENGVFKYFLFPLLQPGLTKFFLIYHFNYFLTRDFS